MNDKWPARIFIFLRRHSSESCESLSFLPRRIIVYGRIDEKAKRLQRDRSTVFLCSGWRWLGAKGGRKAGVKNVLPSRHFIRTDKTRSCKRKKNPRCPYTTDSNRQTPDTFTFAGLDNTRPNQYMRKVKGVLRPIRLIHIYLRISVNNFCNVKKCGSINSYEIYRTEKT